MGKRAAIVAVVVLVAAVAVVGFRWGLIPGMASGTYYTQVDNTQLREGAYLRLSVLPVRGVTEWNEVQYEELPSAVQARMRR